MGQLPVIELGAIQYPIATALLSEICKGSGERQTETKFWGNLSRKRMPYQASLHLPSAGR